MCFRWSHSKALTTVLPGSGSGPLTPCRAMLIAENSRISATLSGVHMLPMCCDAHRMHQHAHGRHRQYSPDFILPGS